MSDPVVASNGHTVKHALWIHSVTNARTVTHWHMHSLAAAAMHAGALSSKHDS